MSAIRSVGNRSVAAGAAGLLLLLFAFIPATAPASTSVAPGPAVAVNVKPNFKFSQTGIRDADGTFRPVDDYAASNDTLTQVNLFPFFMFLVIVGAVWFAVVAFASRNE